MLVQAVGYTEAANRTGIKRDTLYKWGQRKGWKTPVVHAKTESVQFVQRPSDALAQTLTDDSTATKLGFSRAARKVAESLAELPVQRLRMPKEARSAKDWHSVAAGTHGWAEAKQEGFSLQVLSLGELNVQMNPSHEGVSIARRQA